jgi:hypothetical protein
VALEDAHGFSTCVAMGASLVVDPAATRLEPELDHGDAVDRGVEPSVAVPREAVPNWRFAPSSELAGIDAVPLKRAKPASVKRRTSPTLTRMSAVARGAMPTMPVSVEVASSTRTASSAVAWLT